MLRVAGETSCVRDDIEMGAMGRCLRWGPIHGYKYKVIHKTQNAWGPIYGYRYGVLHLRTQNARGTVTGLFIRHRTPDPFTGTSIGSFIRHRTPF